LIVERVAAESDAARDGGSDLTPETGSGSIVRIPAGQNLETADFRMAKKRFQAEQIIGKLCEAEVEISKGQTVAQIAKKLAITEQTYYRWRQKYGGMAPEMSKELKALQKENARLKKLVANQALDMEILKEAAKGNW
jgi:transposase-like protein